MNEPWWFHALAPGAVAAAVARRVPALVAQPLLLATSRSPGATVAYVSAEARAAGVIRGMTVHDGRARCPKGRVMQCPRDAQQALAQMLEASFDVEVKTTGHDEVAMVQRCVEPGLVAAALKSWFRQELVVEAQVGSAAGPIAARVAAWCCGSVPAVIPRGEEAAHLAAAPLMRLEWLPRRGVEVLAHQWAAFTVGDLVELPGALAFRLLGREGADLHMLGRARLRAVPPAAEARVVLHAPTNEISRARQATLRAVDQAWHRLSARRLGATRIELRLWARGRAPARGAATFDPEAEDPVTLGREACRLLAGLSTRCAMDAVEIRLWGGAPAGTQLPLFPDLPAFRVGLLGGALARLRDRYGPTMVRRGSTLDPSRSRRP